MFYLIGLGLFDEKDITLRGLETVKKCQRIYLEAYTSILLVQKEKLEELYGKEVILADREMVESSSDEILKDADNCDVAMLVVGDPMGYVYLKVHVPFIYLFFIYFEKFDSAVYYRLLALTTASLSY